MNRSLSIVLILLLAWNLGGCVSMTKSSTYHPDPPLGSAGTHREGGVVYHLRIKPHWDYVDTPLLISANTAGPPYRISLEASNSRGNVKSFRITRLTITMPDATVHDVLKGRPVDVPPSERNPWCVYYRSPELPLQFGEGAKITVEMHCETGGRQVEIRGSFVGRTEKGTESIWEEYASA